MSVVDVERTGTSRVARDATSGRAVFGRLGLPKQFCTDSASRRIRLSDELLHDPSRKVGTRHAAR